MEETIVAERYENLNSSIREALCRMRNDGLVLQLESHKTSKKYASERLNEVLYEFMNCSREKYIQKLQHDCEEAEIAHDQIIYKIQRVKTKTSLQNREILSKTTLLKSKKEALTANIRKMQSELKEMGKGFNHILTEKDKKLSGLNEVLDNVKDCVSSLKVDVSAMKSKFKTMSLKNVRDMKRIEVLMKSQITKCVFENNSQSTETVDDIDVLQKEEEVRKLKVANSKMETSLKLISNYINTLSSTCGITEIVDEKQSSSIAQSLNSIYDRMSNEEVNKMINVTGTGSSLTRFISETKSKYESELLKKQAELDELIHQAKLRRKKLEFDLQVALKQLDELRKRSLSDDEDRDLFRELQKSRRDYESTTQKLDDTISKLVMHSSSSIRSTYE